MLCTILSFTSTPSDSPPSVGGTQTPTLTNPTESPSMNITHRERYLLHYKLLKLPLLPLNHQPSSLTHTVHITIIHHIRPCTISLTNPTAWLHERNKVITMPCSCWADSFQHAMNPSITNVQKEDFKPSWLDLLWTIYYLDFKFK